MKLSTIHRAGIFLPVSVIDHTSSCRSQKQCQWIAMKDHFIPRCKFCKPCFYIIKNTGNIKQQTQYDIDHVGQVLYKYAKMCHDRTASEREQKQGSA